MRDRPYETGIRDGRMCQKDLAKLPRRACAGSAPHGSRRKAMSSGQVPDLHVATAGADDRPGLIRVRAYRVAGPLGPYRSAPLRPSMVSRIVAEQVFVILLSHWCWTVCSPRRGANLPLHLLSRPVVRDAVGVPLPAHGFQSYKGPTWILGSLTKAAMVARRLLDP